MRARGHMPAALKFTPAIGRSICKLVKAGVPIGVAAQSEGVAKSTLYAWRDRGAAGEKPFAAFHAELEEALAKAEAEITMNVIRAAKKDWKAGAFWLKCRNRELYGDELTINQQVQRGVQDMLDDVLPHMSEAAGAELLHAIGKVMGVERVAAEAARGSGTEPELH